MTLWLVLVMPTFLPARSSLADHPGTRVRLSGTRWALDRQDRVLELEHEPFRGREVRLVRAAPGIRRAPVRHGADDRAAGRVPLDAGQRRRCRAPRPIPDLEEAGLVLRRRDPPARGDRGRGEDPSMGTPMSTVSSAWFTATKSPTAQSNGLASGALLLATRFAHARRPTSLFLVRESVSPHLLAVLDLRYGRVRDEHTYRLVLVDKLLWSQIHEAVELPPHRLVLAAMPAEQLSE